MYIRSYTKFAKTRTLQFRKVPPVILLLFCKASSFQQIGYETNQGFAAEGISKYKWYLYGVQNYIMCNSATAFRYGLIFEAKGGEFMSGEEILTGYIYISLSTYVHMICIPRHNDGFSRGYGMI